MINDIVIEVLDYEMVHWYDDHLFIAHKANTITYITDSCKKKIKMPIAGLGWKKLFMPIRKARRALRIDKSIIVPTNTGFVVIRNGNIYIYNVANDQWIQSETKLNCRNPIYNAALNVEGVLYIGEYGNPNGIGKRILMSKDNGITWKSVHQFGAKEIRHIHALMWDEYEEKIWIFTGDFNPEPQVFKADKDFQHVERVGGGTQQWRACHAIFSEDYVDWVMDCPLEEVHHIRLDRKTNTIQIGQAFAGPVWYAKKYGNVILAASSQEIGPSHKDKKLHLYESDDLNHWEEVAAFNHDGWPKGFFRFGIMTAVKGNKPAFSCEGVKKYDGKTILIKS